MRLKRSILRFNPAAHKLSATVLVVAQHAPDKLRVPIGSQLCNGFF